MSNTLISVGPPRRTKGGRLARLCFRGIIAGLILALGLALVSKGLVIKAKAGVAQILLQSAWSQTLNGKTQVRPWPWADVWPVAEVSIPRLGKSAIALSGTSGQALAFGPGLMDETARPGQPGLSIIAAHRDTHFAFLKDIRIGDLVDVTDETGGQYTYRITETRIVDASQNGLGQSASRSQLALVTCYPFNASTRGPLRFVAIGNLRPAQQ